MKEKLVLQKETIHRLDGSPRPGQQQEASRGANPGVANAERSIFSTTTLITQ
jgi:hypothetical protein